MTDPDGPRPLNYRDGREELRPFAHRLAQVAGGILIGFGVVSALIVMWGLANTNLYNPAPPAPPPPPLPFIWKGPLIVTVVALSAVGSAAYVMYKRNRGRWVAIGVLLGLGLTALGEGLCFGLTYGR